jgi:hypothetical protein
MLRGLKWLVAPALLLIASCATANYASKAPDQSAQSIAGAQLYIYSFLDARSGDLGERMVAQVNEQLTARLTERGVASRIVTYADTTDKPAVGTIMVPVQEIIASRLEEEAEFGADFRLIVMPSDMMIYGANQNYEITWELIDVQTGEIVWTTTLSGSRTVWWNQNEASEGRARTVVDGLIEQMAASGLFNPQSEFAI